MLKQVTVEVMRLADIQPQKSLIWEKIEFAPEVVNARKRGAPIVALESALITHGLPFPYNINIVEEMEAEVRSAGATPATIAILDGIIRVGLEHAHLEHLAAQTTLHKVSPRDLTRLIMRGESGGTTVAGTMFIASAIGITVFATGGIGGVHRSSGQERGKSWDVSADLPQLANTPMIVICAGAKAILDLSATIEYLETHGVPVVGYQTDRFPAFYTRSSRLPVSARADSTDEVVQMAHIHWGLGLKSALLVTVPPPLEVALPEETVRQAVREALKVAREEGVRGQKVTPFLLEKVNEITGQASLMANLGLLRNNARVAGEIAVALVKLRRPTERII